jgi:hypothetical protein
VLSVIRREQVAVRAARRVRKVAGPITVTTQANLPLEPDSVAVAGVTAFASLMFGHSVQARQLRRLVTRGARWWLGLARGAVRAVTARTILGQLAVCRRGLLSVAARASLHGVSTAMRFVTVRAELVAGWSACVLGLVAGAARGGLRAGVRLVAARAVRVSGERGSRLLAMARAASRAERFRTVR